MPNLVLQPASGQEAAIHYENTIRKGVSLTDIAKYLTPDQQKELKVIYKESAIQIWGIVPGVKNANFPKWLKINPGDIVFFSQRGNLVGKAIVTYKLHSRPLAIDLWGQDEDGETWEYVYFLNDFEELSIPIKKFNNIIGFKENFPIYGVMVLDQKRTEEVISSLGSVDEFLEEIGLPESISKTEKELVDSNLPKEVSQIDWDKVIDRIENQIKDKPLSTVKRVAKYILRNSGLSKTLKKKYNYKCQICGLDGFLKRSEEPYAEVHHVIGVGNGGADLSHNLLVVCANCHRKLEYAKIEFDDIRGSIKINDEPYKIMYK